MLSDDLIGTARLLVNSGSAGKPKQSDLRRAISTAYYAMFHTLAKCCADLLVGSTSSRRSPEAWRQVYRSLDHSHAKECCSRPQMMSKFPTVIQDFANTFAGMQEKRHKADYDPNEKFFKSAVLIDINLTESHIDDFKKAPGNDRCAFAVYVLLKQRKK